MLCLRFRTILKSVWLTGLLIASSFGTSLASTSVSANLTGSISPFLNVVISTPNVSQNVHPFGGNYTLPINGSIQTNNPGVGPASNPNKINVTVPLSLSLWDAGFNNSIPVSFSGTIGTRPLSNPMFPYFTGGVANIAINGTIHQSDIPLSLPPGAYTGTYTVTATYNP